MNVTNDNKFSIRLLKTLLKKDPKDFKRKDLLRAIEEYGIQQINLHYAGLDGKLKELKIPINSLEYADLILAQGERIDGSNIFKGIIPPDRSDLYIVPIYKTAFISPFEENTMGILCKFLDKNGEWTSCAPDNILYNAHESLKKNTGCTLNVLGELEFYIIYEQDNPLFAGTIQGGYHQSSPFVKNRQMLNEIMQIISALTGSIKYAHSEVGYIDRLKSTTIEVSNKRCEQYEIEFLPRPIEDMAYYLTLAKWVIRNIAYKWGCTATFTPKLEEGMAGNGLHFHIELQKDGKSIMVDPDGNLSDISKQLIGGLLKFASSITAFGNTVSSAYLRLVSNQEAPTKICWSEQDRSALVRIPLGWTNVFAMDKKVNPQQKEVFQNESGSRQTIELRSPDGSASITLLLAALTVAAEYGLTDQDSNNIAEKLYIDKDKINNQEFMESLNSLPASCAESSDALIKQRSFYEKNNIFPPQIINYTIEQLLLEKDRNINKRFSQLTADMRLKATRDIMHKDLHKH